MTVSDREGIASRMKDNHIDYLGYEMMGENFKPIIKVQRMD